MADLESILSVLGGLNTDDSLISPPEGKSPFESDYRYARNVRIGSSDEDNTGGAETIPSSLLVNSYYQWNGSAFASGSVPAGTFTCIGKYEDESEAKLYWACHNSSGNHVILMFDKITRIIYEMIQWSGLNFNLQYPVQFMKINKYFGFTDKLNPPRMFDSTDIYRLKQTLGGNFSEYHLTWAKWAPVAPIVVNAVVGFAFFPTGQKLYQWTYRYIYKGGFRSTFAPPTKFYSNSFEYSALGAVFGFKLNITGFIFDYNNPANTSFDHADVRFYEWVEYIEIVYRESDIDSWGLWKRFPVDKVSPTNNQTFYFGVNEAPSISTLIPTSEIGQYFDSVPLLSGSCDAIDNRPMFGDNEDEFPAITDFDVTNIEVYTNLGVDYSLNWYKNKDYTGLTSGVAQQLYRDNLASRYSFKERGIYKGGIIYHHWSGRTNLVTTLDEWTYEIPTVNLSGQPGAIRPVSEAIHALGFKIAGSVTPPDWAVGYQIVVSNALNFDFFLHGLVDDYVFLQNDPNGLNDDISTPSGIKSALSGFYDNYNSESAKDLPLLSRVLGEIRKNKIATSAQSSGFIYFKISNWFLPSKKDSGGGNDNPSNNLFYSFRQGDKVRFFAADTLPFSAANLVPFEADIIAFTGNGIICTKPPNLLSMRTRVFGGAGLLEGEFQIEIYRPPKNTGEPLFYERGEWYPITQPTTPSRDFSKRDFTYSGNPSVSYALNNGYPVYTKYPITAGDVFMVKKNFYYTYLSSSSPGIVSDWLWAQMNENPQKAYDQWQRNSRPLAAYRYLPVNQDKPTQIRFGGKFLEDSIFISINTFKDDWQFIYPSEYGRIRKLSNTNNAQVESVGNILLVLGEDEPWSVYVNRATLEDLSGSTQVSVSDKVLGSYNTLLGSFGCINPESVSVQDGKVIWWSEKKGSWVRYARDGITNISDRKMKNWYKDLSELIRNTYATSTPAKVIAIFDEYHNRWITRIDHSSLPGTFKGYSSYKCTTFSEADGRWKEHLDFAPDYFASIDTEVYGIQGRLIQIHEAGNDYLNFYGNTVVAQIELASAIDMRKVKSWKALALDATDKWSFESIKGDWRSNSATIQETRLKLASLDLREGVYWSEIKQDMNSPNGASTEAKIVNGNPMKSRTLRLLMQLDPTVNWLSVFNWLIVSYTDSPKNPKN